MPIDTGKRINASLPRGNAPENAQFEVIRVISVHLHQFTRLGEIASFSLTMPVDRLTVLDLLGGSKRFFAVFPNEGFDRTSN
jgi:hypothetical protein